MPSRCIIIRLLERSGCAILADMAKKDRPSDPNQLAKFIVDQATGEQEPNAAMRREMAKWLGARGGQKGGPARAAALSPSRRAEIARKAAATRWKKKSDK